MKLCLLYSCSGTFFIIIKTFAFHINCHVLWNSTLKKFRLKSVWCNFSTGTCIANFNESGDSAYTFQNLISPKIFLFVVFVIMYRNNCVKYIYDIYLTKFWIQCTYDSSPPLLHWQLPELAAPVTWLLSSVYLEQLSSFWILLECLTTVSIIKQYAHVIKKKVSNKLDVSHG